MEEIWKDIPDYEGMYQVSNDGNVKSLPKMGKGHKMIHRLTGVIMSPSKGRSGYYGVSLMKNDKKKRIEIHRLIAITFIPNPADKPQVNHKDGDKLNNRVSNLEWCTGSENCKHCLLNGLRKTARGVNKPNSRFTEQDVIDIKTRLLNLESQATIAKIYSVNPCIIQNINSGRPWKHITI